MSTMSPLTGLRSVKCYGCGCTIDVVLLSGDAEPYNGAKALCDPCTVKYDEKRIRDERIQDYGILEDQERINGDCRASCFRNSKPAIEADNPDAWKYARQWKYNSENIFLHGKTGTGKTFIANCLLNKMYGEGKSIECVHANRFCMDSKQSWGEGATNFKRWCYVSLLLVDDIDKGMWCELSMRALLELMDKRHTGNRRTLFTSNKKPEDLRNDLAKATQNNKSISQAIMNRMKPVIEFEIKGESHR